MNMDMNTSSGMASDMAPHKSGYFSGHAFAATGFISFGCFFLGLTLKRARNLPRGVTFAEAHIPEKNSSLLIRGGLSVILMALLGCATETGWDNIIAPATHISLYLSSAFMGVAALLEGLKRLPPDSWRLSVAVAMVLHYIIWHEHALMKQLPADFRLHELLAQLCLVGAALIAYSIKYPKNVIAYVAAQAACVLMGLWLYTGGVYAAFIDIPAGLIGVLFVAEALFVLLVVTLGAAFLVPQSHSSDIPYYSVPEKEALCSPTKSEETKPKTVPV